MRFKLSFSVDAWLDGLEIEAEDLDKAKEKLASMTLEEIIEERVEEKNSSFKSIDATVIEKTVDAEIKNIKYDISPVDVEESEYYVSRVSKLDPNAEDFDEQVEKIYEDAENEITSKLPSKLSLENVTVYGNTDDAVESALADAITLKTDWFVDTFEYTVKKEY